MKISNVTSGSINTQNNTMIIQVPANDHPYGLFQFQHKQLSVRENQVSDPTIRSLFLQIIVKPILGKGAFQNAHLGAWVGVNLFNTAPMTIKASQNA